MANLAKVANISGPGRGAIFISVPSIGGEQPEPEAMGTAFFGGRDALGLARRIEGLLADAAARIAAGYEAFGVSNGPFWVIAAARARGEPVPAPILVGTGQVGDLVVIEEHLRLTAYFLRPETITPEMEVIVGTSSALKRWTEY